MSQDIFSKPEINSSKTKDQPECVPGSASPTLLTDRQQSPCGHSGAGLIWVLLFFFFLIQHSPPGDH